MRPILCLDFDGVLCDSLDECFVVGYNTFYDRDITMPNQAPSTLYQFFCHHRYLVAPADDFYLLFHAFEMGIGSLDRGKFEQLKISTIADCQNFSIGFFARRQAQKITVDRWLAWHHLYAQSRAVLLEDFPEFFIVTTKDRDSVERLASFHGYRHKLLGIYARERSIDKRILFQHLFSENEINPQTQRVIFIDDNREQLARVANLGMATYLAGWGYTGPLEEDGFSTVENLDEIAC